MGGLGLPLLVLRNHKDLVFRVPVERLQHDVVAARRESNLRLPVRGVLLQKEGGEEEEKTTGGSLAENHEGRQGPVCPKDKGREDVVLLLPTHPSDRQLLQSQFMVGIT